MVKGTVDSYPVEMVKYDDTDEFGNIIQKVVVGVYDKFGTLKTQFDVPANNFNKLVSEWSTEFRPDNTGYRVVLAMLWHEVTK